MHENGMAIQGNPQLRAGDRKIAWRGVSLHVPAAWDLGQHSGDDVEGSFRLDAPESVAMHVQWSRLPRQVKLDAYALKQAQKISGLSSAEISPASWASELFHIEASPFNHAAAVQWEKKNASGEAGVAMTGVCQAAGKLFVLHLPMTPERSRDVFVRILASLRIAGNGEVCDWDFFDLHFTTAPGMLLEESQLSVGLCRLQFRSNGRWIALRRASTANAAMNTMTPDAAALERWLRAIYSNEFYSYKWSISTAPSPRRDGVMQWLLAPSSSNAATHLVTRCFSRFRSQPRCVVVQWDARENKICCVELDRDFSQMDESQQQLLASLRCQWVHAEEISEINPRAESSGNQRFLTGIIARQPLVRTQCNEAGHVQLKLLLRRPSGLRVLRAFAGLSNEEVVRERVVDLDLIGAWVWSQCKTPMTVGQLVSALEREFRIVPLEARRSVSGYLRSLRERGLITLDFSADGL